MAPKKSVAMKRPAALISDMENSIQEPPKQRKVPAITPASNSILGVLQDELSSSVLDVLAVIIKRQTGTPTALQRHEEIALKMASEAMASAQARYRVEVNDTQAAVESAGIARATKFKALEEAEAELMETKNKIAEAKLGIKTSMKVVESVHQEMQRVKAAEKSGSGRVELMTKQIAQLASVKQTTFLPLKEASAKGAAGKKMLQHLVRVGKQFEFHDVLLNTTVPKVLAKRLEKRQTFDRFALEQMEGEFAKKRTHLETALQAQEKGKIDCEVAMKEAQDKRIIAQQQRDAHALTLANAREMLSSSRKSMAVARRAFHDRDSASELIVREAAQAEERLQAFLDGPLVAFKELEKSVMSADMQAFPSPLSKAVALEPASPDARKPAVTVVYSLSQTAAAEDQKEDSIEETDVEGTSG